MALACVCPADDLSSLSISGSLATSSCRAAHFAALCPSLNALRLTLPRRLARIYHHSRRPGDVYRARGAARPLRAARLSHAHGRAWGAALIILTQGQCLSLASASEVGGSTPLGRQGSLPPLDDVNGAWPPLESSSNPRTLALAPHRPLASPWLARLGSRAAARAVLGSSGETAREDVVRRAPALRRRQGRLRRRGARTQANFKLYKKTKRNTISHLILCYEWWCLQLQAVPEAASSEFLLGFMLSVRIRSRLRRRVRVFVPLVFFEKV